MLKLGRKGKGKRGLSQINRPPGRKRRCKNRRARFKAFNYQFKEQEQARSVASQSA